MCYKSITHVLYIHVCPVLIDGGTLFAMLWTSRHCFNTGTTYVNIERLCFNVYRSQIDVIIYGRGSVNIVYVIWKNMVHRGI